MIADLCPADARVLETQKKLLTHKCPVSVHRHMPVVERREEECARRELVLPALVAPAAAVPGRSRKRRRGAQGPIDHSE